MNFKPSDNDYDWLGPGIYFWEANPVRGLDFAVEALRRSKSNTSRPTVVGAVIDLGLCLDLTTSIGVDWLRIAFASLVEVTQTVGLNLPSNSDDHLKRYLDCAVVRRLHKILDAQNQSPVDTVKGVFTEGQPAYPGSGFNEKTHIQIAVRNPQCIKAVFRVPPEELRAVRW